MGLDMWLYAKKYFFGNDEMITKISKEFPEMEGFECKEVKFEVAYWRKANQIHKWFVDNCQDGVDECQNSFVSKENLEELLKLVKEVLENHDKAEELLPCGEGFFFGGNEYDEDYFDDLNNTKEMLEKILNRIKENKGWDIYYSSSW